MFIIFYICENDVDCPELNVNIRVKRKQIITIKRIRPINPQKSHRNRPVINKL